MSHTFTALDFETATPQIPNICQVGIVQFINGEIANEINILVQPHNNYYWDRFIDIHGITPAKTRNAATFNRIWRDIEPYIANQVVVAHNGLSFVQYSKKHYTTIILLYHNTKSKIPEESIKRGFQIYAESLQCN